MACIKTLVLNQAPKTMSDHAQGPKGRDIGKSGVAVVCHGCFLDACPAPYYPSALLTGSRLGAGKMLFVGMISKSETGSHSTLEQVLGEPKIRAQGGTKTNLTGFLFQFKKKVENEPRTS